MPITAKICYVASDSWITRHIALIAIEGKIAYQRKHLLYVEYTALCSAKLSIAYLLPGEFYKGNNIRDTASFSS
jgi:hypothetical protein